MIQITIASVNVEAPSWQKPSPPGVSWDNPEVNWFLVKTFQTPAWICPLDHPYHSLAPLSAGDGFEHLQNSRKKYSNCIFFWFWLKMASYWIFLTKLGAYYVRRPALLTLMGHQLSAKIQVQLGCSFAIAAQQGLIRDINLGCVGYDLKQGMHNAAHWLETSHNFLLAMLSPLANILISDWIWAATFNPNVHLP